MDRETAKKILPIIQHVAEHGMDDVEYLSNSGRWTSASGCMLSSKPERYRIKPKPVTRPWSAPEDVPGPVCWLRKKGAEGFSSMVVAVRSDGLRCTKDDDTLRVVDWYDLEIREYSTDRKTWHPCTLTEEA